MRRTLVAIAAVQLAATAAYVLVLRDRQLRWGATGGEVAAVLPGDAILPTADLTATRAIAVRAPRSDVWPWVAQLGQGRGGFYSYDRLENLAGCEVSSAERIVGQWQHPAVGDDFRLHPDITLSVAVVEPPHALVAAGIVLPPAADDGSPAQPGAPYDFTWAFVLLDDGQGGTRLVVRERYRYRTGWAPAMVEPVSAISFVMTQRMLRGIRDRAERPARSGSGSA